jgi:hypothetical protein
MALLADNLALGFTRTGEFSRPDGPHGVATMWRERR